ncbi:MAG: response regulator [Mesorhizobium sp.]|nr:response regulator [Mesorhizobium sp.]
MGETPERIRVYIVDDDPSVLDSLRALLTAHRFEVVPTNSAEEFLLLYEPTVPACLLLDLRMQGMSGMELQAELSQTAPGLPIIILTGHGDIPLAVRAMKLGAIDFIQKPGSQEQLLAAIDQARDYLGNRSHLALSPDEVARRLARLTSREREVLDHLVQGQTNKFIADQLGISQRTVEIHRARIREKLEAKGLADLIRMMR